MNSRDSASLDRYITGNYGEDQFKGEDELERTLERLTVLRETEQATWLAFREAEETMHRCNTAWGQASTAKRQAFDTAMLAHGLTFDALLDLLEEE